MTSSTLPSDRAATPARVPRLAVALLALFVLAGLASGYYTLRWNPEVRFWAEVAGRKTDWLDHVRREAGWAVLLAGGSSTAFAVDAGMLWKEHGIPAANLALHAGKGADFLLRFALDAAQPGDVLILALEPALLSGDVHTLPLGAQVAFAIDKRHLLRDDRRQGWRASEWRYLPALRPGAYHAVTMIGKWWMRRPGYRYDTEDYRDGGMLVTAERRAITGPPDAAPARIPACSPQGWALLEETKKRAEEKGVTVVYGLPWAYVSPARAESMRQAGAAYAQHIERILPVIPEPQWGVHDVITDFADTSQHLIEPAARTRTIHFAQTLGQWLEEHGHPAP